MGFLIMAVPVTIAGAVVNGWEGAGVALALSIVAWWSGWCADGQC